MPSITVTPPKSKAIFGDPAGLAARLMREWEQSPPLTGEVEAYRNFLQALLREASRLRVIDGEFQGDAARCVIDAVELKMNVGGRTYTVAKERMWNTAPSLPARESMLHYFQTIGASEGESASWAPDNMDGRFGQGVRQGFLPENHFGFVIIAVHENGDEFMMWIEFDKDDQVYALKPLGLPTINMDGEPDVEWAPVSDVASHYGIDFGPLVPEEVRKWGGMVLLSLGMSPEENTALGATDKRARHAGIDPEKAIQDRIFDASRLTIAPLVTWNTDAKVGGAKFKIDTPDVKGAFRLDQRTLGCHRDWFDPSMNPGVQTAVLVHPDGTKFTIGLRPEAKDLPKGRKRHGVAARGQIVEVLYGNDVHSLYGSRNDLATVMDLVAPDKAVGSRTGLLIEPPVVRTGKEPWGITQDGTRSHLFVRDGATGRQVLLSSAPRRFEWRDFLADNLPPFIREALADESAKRASKGTDFKKVMKDVLSTIKARHAATSIRKDPDGKEPGFASDERGSGQQDSDQNVPDPDGTGGEAPKVVEKPAPEERPDVNCPNGCTGKFHREDCPLRSEGGGGAPPKTEPTETSGDEGSLPTKPGRQTTVVEFLIADPDGDQKGTPRKYPGLPDVEWLVQDAFYGVVPLDHPDDGGHDFPCHFDPNATPRVIRFNWNHRRFADLRDFYNNTWRKTAKPTIRAHMTQDMVDDAIKEAFTEVVAGTILDLVREERDREVRAKRLAPENLETVTRGDFNVKYRIESLLGDYARLGSKGAYIPGGVPDPKDSAA